MAHTITNKKKLIARVRRIRGQVEALEAALEKEFDCSVILHQIAGCRGAMNGLMAEVVEGHIRSHLMTDDSNRKKHLKAGEDLISVINSYLK